MIGESFLTAAACCHFSPQSSAAGGRIELHEYDLCFPLNAIPLTPLRSALPAWITERSLRALATLPFLFPGKRDVWRKHATNFCERIGVDSLYALMPAYDLWWKPFAEWTKADLRHPDHLSLLWTITTGEVLAYQASSSARR